MFDPSSMRGAPGPFLPDFDEPRLLLFDSDPSVAAPSFVSLSSTCLAGLKSSFTESCNSRGLPASSRPLLALVRGSRPALPSPDPDVFPCSSLYVFFFCQSSLAAGAIVSVDDGLMAQSPELHGAQATLPQGSQGAPQGGAHRRHPKPP
jgi:hypothetical protein